MADLPLGEEDRVKIDASLQQLTDLDEVIIRAGQAGIDVTKQKTRVKELRGQLKKMKTAFFPNA